MKNKGNLLNSACSQMLDKTVVENKASKAKAAVQLTTIAMFSKLQCCAKSLYHT